MFKLQTSMTAQVLLPHSLIQTTLEPLRRNMSSAKWHVDILVRGGDSLKQNAKLRHVKAYEQWRLKAFVKEGCRRTFSMGLLPHCHGNAKKNAGILARSLAPCCVRLEKTYLNSVYQLSQESKPAPRPFSKKKRSALKRSACPAVA